MPRDYQEEFIKSCYDALNGTVSKNLQEAKSNNEHAAIRNVGFTIETKPDYCKKRTCRLDVKLWDYKNRDWSSIITRKNIQKSKQRSQL